MNSNLIFSFSNAVKLTAKEEISYLTKVTATPCDIRYLNLPSFDAAE